MVPIAMGHVTSKLAALAVLAALSQTAAAASVEDALDAYVKGLRIGDMKTLGEVFFADGQFCRANQGGIRCSSFAEVLPSWVERPDPKARGKVVSKEVVGDSMANVIYELEFGGDTYIDNLLLYKKEGRWVVVAKTTTIKP